MASYDVSYYEIDAATHNEFSPSRLLRTQNGKDLDDIIHVISKNSCNTWYVPISFCYSDRTPLVRNLSLKYSKKFEPG